MKWDIILPFFILFNIVINQKSYITSSTKIQKGVLLVLRFRLKYSKIHHDAFGYMNYEISRNLKCVTKMCLLEIVKEFETGYNSHLFSCYRI
jgi:hypothetical protein